MPPPPPKFSGYNSRPTGWGNSESTVMVLPSTAVFFHGTYRGAQSVVPPNTNVEQQQQLPSYETTLNELQYSAVTFKLSEKF